MKIKVGLAQLKPSLGDLERNLELHLSLIKRAKSDKLDLIVFPELSLTGYFLKDMVPVVSLNLQAPIIEKLKQESKGISIIFGFVEESEDHEFYNSAAYLEDGRVIKVHRKVYLPTYGMFDEHRYFGSGERIRAFETKFGRVGILICEDAWHPSTSYILAEDGAKLVFFLSSSPARGIREGEQIGSAQIWERINRTTAFSYSLYVVSVNRVGYEDGVNFWGGSEIIGPDGQVVVKGEYLQEGFLSETLDLGKVRRARMYTPLLRDEKLYLTLRELERIYEQRVANQP